MSAPARTILAPCSRPSTPLRAASGGLRPALTATARDASRTSGRDGKTPSSRTEKRHCSHGFAILQNSTHTTAALAHSWEHHIATAGAKSYRPGIKGSALPGKGETPAAIDRDDLAMMVEILCRRGGRGDTVSAYPHHQGIGEPDDGQSNQPTRRTAC